MAVTGPRELVHASSIADTVRDVVPTAKTSEELRVWCIELADKIETYSNLAPGEVDTLERGLADERIVDLERQLAELQRVSTESAAHWQQQVTDLEMKLSVCEGMVVPLLAVEMRAIRICVDVGALPVEQNPSTAELITVLDSLPRLQTYG